MSVTPGDLAEHALLEIASRAPSETHAAESRAIEHEVLGLFAQCRTRLTRYVTAFGLRVDEAEDIVQDVFISLYRHLRLGRPRDNLRGWIFRVAHNQALKERQRSDRARKVGVELVSDAYHTDTPERILEEERRQDRVRAAIAAMPERDRLCLTLRAEGLRYRDIARTLDMSLGSVSNSLARSFAKLAEIEGDRS